jgi:hypothetical protein
MVPLQARADDGQAASKPAKLDAHALAKARAAARKAVHQAIQQLAKEFEAHGSDAATPLRTQCNYFTENPSTDLTPEAILEGISSVDGPIAESCYIRWQLLSGLPEKADNKLAPQIGELYAEAPAPLANPSITPNQRAGLDSQTMRMTADQESLVNTAWSKHIEDWKAQNAPIISYSNKLFAMLPEGLGAFTLGMQDAYQRRAASGVDCSDFINSIIQSSRNWAVAASPEELSAAAQVCDRWARAYNGSFPPQVYTSVAWNDQNRRLVWQAKGIDCVPVDTLNDFRKFLISQANTPGGGIQAKPAD